MNPRKLFPFSCTVLICVISWNTLCAEDADLSLETNWFPRVSTTTHTLWSVTYGDNRFVAVGERGTILTSDGGGQWTAVSTAFQGDLYSIRFVNGQFMAGTTNGILVSTNALQWTYLPITVPAFGNYAFRFKGFAFGSGRFVAIASSSDGAVSTAILSSPDGVVWSQRYASSSFAPKYHSCDITFGDSAFVAAQNSSAEHRFMKSLDGHIWLPTGPSEASLPPNSYQVEAITHGNGLFMAAGYAGIGPVAGYLYRSTNGANWNALGNYVFQGRFSSIAYGAGRFVALGSWVLRVSTNNGASWKGNDPSNPIDWYPMSSVCYGSGTFVGVGGNGTIIQSAAVEDTPPFFITTPTNQVVQRGSTAILKSRAGGSEPLSYQWHKDGSPLPNGTNATLAITNAQPSDAGSYTIVVSSPFGSITNSPVSLAVSFVNIASYAGLTIEGIPGRTYRVEYLNAMSASSEWQTLTNLVLPTSPYIWIDYASPSVAKRFYRASELP